MKKRNHRRTTRVVECKLGYYSLCIFDVYSPRMWHCFFLPHMWHCYSILSSRLSRHCQVLTVCRCHCRCRCRCQRLLPGRLARQEGQRCSKLQKVISFLIYLHLVKNIYHFQVKTVIIKGPKHTDSYYLLLLVIIEGQKHTDSYYLLLLVIIKGPKHTDSYY